MRLALVVLALLTTPALADPAGLTFDTGKLCQWQLDNNSMPLDECTRMEGEAQATVADLEKSATAERKTQCEKEARDYSGDSGFASYTVYATCLKDGPGNL
ncbi:MAG TPA: hypothetical protein PKE19_01475 [Aestuariivirga sp.]|nr:hypothetical protein [Aestuariivirga sp.]